MSDEIPDFQFTDADGNQLDIQRETEEPSVPATKEPSIMEIVSRLANAPIPTLENVTVIERLLLMQERAEDRQAKRQFAEALHALQTERPTINKHGEIWVKGALRSTYARIEDLDDVLKPLMDKHGFAFTLSETGISEGMRVFDGTLLHRGGAEKTLTINLPLDKSEFRTQVQSEGSTMSYARRQLLKAHFNIIEHGVDDDGSGQNVQTISDDEEKDLNAKLDEVKASKTGFLKYFEIKKLADLKRVDLPRAYEMIDRKLKKQLLQPPPLQTAPPPEPPEPTLYDDPSG